MKINEQLAKVLAKAKVNVVETKALRNAKGHFTGAHELVLDGKAVSDPFKRTYFRNHRLAGLTGVTLRKVRKNSGKVILEVAA